jgi:predicted HicB family RNase H-like nuclease
MGRKKKKVVRTTILLPPEVHQALRIEAITKKMSMGEPIVQKLRELEEYREKYGGVVRAEDYLT